MEASKRSFRPSSESGAVQKRYQVSGPARKAPPPPKKKQQLEKCKSEEASPSHQEKKRRTPPPPPLNAQRSLDIPQSRGSPPRPPKPPSTSSLPGNPLSPTVQHHLQTSMPPRSNSCNIATVTKPAKCPPTYTPKLQRGSPKHAPPLPPMANMDNDDDDEYIVPDLKIHTDNAATVTKPAKYPPTHTPRYDLQQGSPKRAPPLLPMANVDNNDDDEYVVPDLHTDTAATVTKPAKPPRQESRSPKRAPPLPPMANVDNDDDEYVFPDVHTDTATTVTKPAKPLRQESRSPKHAPSLPPMANVDNDDDEYIIPDLPIANNDESIYEEICCTLPVTVGTVKNKKAKPPPVARKPIKPPVHPDSSLYNNTGYVAMIPTSSGEVNSKLHVPPRPPRPKPSMPDGGNLSNLDQDMYEEMNAGTQPSQEVYEEINPIEVPPDVPQRTTSDSSSQRNSQIDYEIPVSVSPLQLQEVYEDMNPEQPDTQPWNSRSTPALPLPPANGQEFTQNYSDYSNQECIYATIPDVLN